MGWGGGPLKRIYFLVAVAVLQMIAGSLLLVGAAQPVRISPNVVVLSGEYYHVDFAILGTGQMSGNLSELQSQSFDVFVFDDPGYASFRDGSNSLPPLFEKSGTNIAFDLGGNEFEPSRNDARSEEHTSELQSPCNLVCRLLLEKK